MWLNFHYKSGNVRLKSYAEKKRWQHSWKLFGYCNVPVTQSSPVFLPGEFHGQSSLAGWVAQSWMRLNSVQHILTVFQQHHWFISNPTNLAVESSVLGQSWKSQALEPDYLDLNPSTAPYGCLIVDQGSCSAVWLSGSLFVKHGWQ